MTALRVIFGVFIGLIVITLVAESIELVTVKIVSGKSFSELTANERDYFERRNVIGILLFKILYSFFAGFAGGYLAAKISSARPQLAIILLIIIQVIPLIWSGFFSELSQTGPTWMWIYLIFVIPLGIILGQNFYLRKTPNKKG